MKARVLTTIAELEELAQPWRALDSLHPEDPFTLTFEYVRAWARQVHQPDQLCIVVAEDAGELVGAFPLVARRRSLGPARWEQLEFVTEGDYRDAVVDDRRVGASTTIKALLGAMHEQHPAARRLNLLYLRPGTPLIHHLLKSAADNPATRPHVEIPRIELSRHAGFAKYRRTIPRSSITSLNKMRRELDLKVQLVWAPDAPLYGELAKLHRRQQETLRGEGRAERRSLFEDPRREAAYRELTVGNEATGAIVARTGEGRIAFYELLWRRGGTVQAWNTAYEPDFASYRPSRARLAGIELLYETPEVHTFDLGAGRYPWKFELTPFAQMAYHHTRWLGDDRLARTLARVRP